MPTKSAARQTRPSSTVGFDRHNGHVLRSNAALTVPLVKHSVAGLSILAQRPVVRIVLDTAAMMLLDTYHSKVTKA